MAAPHAAAPAPCMPAGLTRERQQVKCSYDGLARLGHAAKMGGIFVLPLLHLADQLGCATIQSQLGACRVMGKRRQHSQLQTASLAMAVPARDAPPRCCRQRSRRSCPRLRCAPRSRRAAGRAAAPPESGKSSHAGFRTGHGLGVAKRVFECNRAEGPHSMAP